MTEQLTPQQLDAINALSAEEAKKPTNTMKYRPNTYQYMGDIPEVGLKAGDLFNIWDTMI